MNGSQIQTRRHVSFCICPGESNNENRSEFAICLELKSNIYADGWNKKWYEELEMNPMVLNFMA